MTPVDDVHDFSRIESGRTEIDVSEGSAAEAMAGVATLVEASRGGQSAAVG